jgi:hypothetical protein
VKKLAVIAVVIVLAVAGWLTAQQPVTIQQWAGGAAILFGHGTAAGALRVELPTDGTGQVALASGTTVGLSSGAQANPVPQSSSSYAASAFDLTATAATNVKSSGGNVWGWYGYNPNASTCFLQFYNASSATLGTSALHPFGVLAGGSFNVMPGSIAAFNLSTAISTGQTTTATGSTQCSSPMVITLLYN